MIGRIRGILVAKHPPEIALECGGLTYEIQVPMSTLYRLPDPGQELLLHTHYVVREDAHSLYGFHDARSKALFRTLIRIGGVGPKLALAILSAMEVDEFVRTVHDNDVAAISSVPGIGRKTAERLIVEMRDRLGEWGAGAAPDMEAPAQAASWTAEAKTALVALGYKPQQAARTITSVLRENPGIADSETLIRLSLKRMAG